jgi:hypothetical protein
MVEKLPFNELGLRILGVAMASFSWAFVVFPNSQISWKGGNRAPLSGRSRFLVAIMATSWCLTTFRLYPLFFATLFAICAMLGLYESGRDRAAFDTARGRDSNQRKVLTAAEYWLPLCIIDGLIFFLMLYAFVRDLQHPPQTDEQHIVHLMGMGFLVASIVGGVCLYVTRPPKGTRTQN